MPYLLPMLFMMVTTLTAMGLKLADYAREKQITLLVVGACISLIALWLVVEAILALHRDRSRRGPTPGLDLG